jgi:hypothetical protein
MNEDEWLACLDMVQLVACSPRGISDRKRRLFLCACCRRIWHLLEDERSRRGVEVAERFADGLADPPELQAAREAAWAAARERIAPVVAKIEADYAADGVDYYYEEYMYHDHLLAAPAASAAAFAAEADRDLSFLGPHYARMAKLRAEMPPGVPRGADWYAQDVAADRADYAAQFSLLRDILGNPFRPPPSLDPAWITRGDGAIPAMARTIYDERSFNLLPKLADVLEGRGCTIQDILAHCRQPGEHIRGCWVIDDLIGKG